MPSTTQTPTTDEAQRSAERIEALVTQLYCVADIAREVTDIIREEHAELYAIRDAAIKWNRVTKAGDTVRRFNEVVGLIKRLHALGVGDEQDAEPQT